MRRFDRRISSEATISRRMLGTCRLRSQVLPLPLLRYRRLALSSTKHLPDLVRDIKLNLTLYSIPPTAAPTFCREVPPIATEEVFPPASPASPAYCSMAATMDSTMI